MVEKKVYYDLLRSRDAYDVRLGALIFYGRTTSAPSPYLINNNIHHISPVLPLTFIAIDGAALSTLK